ncbi:tetratricopeptide repeat protein [Microcoleus vaginatus PCC 9802]|nr:tetratricopeptide repeat protein [Microcoleus vaginatus PCC 9802]
MKLGYIYYGQGDYETALINFNRALQIRPGDAYAVKAVYNTKSAIVQSSVKE